MRRLEKRETLGKEAGENDVKVKFEIHSSKMNPVAIIVLLATVGAKGVHEGSSNTANATLTFGPPQTFKGYGGKMSNVLDLYPDGFASGPGVKYSSVDGGRTFQVVPCAFNGSANCNGNRSNATFFSDFAFHTDANGRVAQDFGNGLVYAHSPNVTSVTFNATSVWRFQGENLTWQNGPDITFEGLPHPVCANGKQPGFISPHASGR